MPRSRGSCWLPSQLASGPSPSPASTSSFSSLGSAIEVGDCLGSAASQAHAGFDNGLVGLVGFDDQDSAGYAIPLPTSHRGPIRGDEAHLGKAASAGPSEQPLD